MSIEPYSAPIAAARRMEKMTSHFFAAQGARIAAMQAAGQDVIRLDIGSPDLPPAPFIVDALSRSASAANHHGYQPHSATPALRAAWAALYQRLYDVELDPDREVVPLLGSKEGIFNMSMAHIDPGDLALVPDPGYVTYSRSALFAGGEPYYLPLRPELGFLPDLGAVPADIAQRSKLLWLNYPNNPTAATATREFFSQAVDFAREHNLLVCHDAAYTLVAFDGYQAPSLLQVPGAREVGVEFNTLSKSHNMAGWRAAAVVGNAQALKNLYDLKTNLDSGHFLPVWDAAVAALTGDQSWLPERNEIYRRRRDLLLPALHSFGMEAETPHASLYIWCRVPPGGTSMSFSNWLLEEAQVSLTPGTVFGEQGEGFLRIAMTATEDKTGEAIERMRRAIGRGFPSGKGG